MEHEGNKGRRSERRTRSVLTLVAVLMFLATSAVPVLLYDMNGSDNASGEDDFIIPQEQTDFTDYKEVTSYLDLAKIGNEPDWPLSGKYYLSDDIVFTDDTNDGINININIETESNRFTITLNPVGATVSSFYVYNSGRYWTTTSNTITITNPTPLFDDTLIIGGIAGGQRFAYTTVISNKTETFNSNGNFTPIGLNANYSASVFTGILDGNNHTISGINIAVHHTTASYSAGLFAYLGGTVKNLGLVDYDLTVTSTIGYIDAGGIAGRSRSGASISNCFVEGNITVGGVQYPRLGGMIGYGVSTSIDNSYVDCQIISSAEIVHAGIVGWMSAGSITNSYRSGDMKVISYGNSMVGGIVGYMDASTRSNPNVISSCYSSGQMDVTSLYYTLYIGGIAGYAATAGTEIKDCYNAAEISITSLLTNHIGGIIGYLALDGAYLTNCYNKGKMTLTSNSNVFGGIAGTVVYATNHITNCYFLENNIFISGTPTPAADKISAGNPVIDGNTSRPNDKGSGAKTSEQMTPTLSDARAGSSIYHIDTTIVTSRTLLGWDFNDIWSIISGVNDGFPILRRALGDIKITIVEEPEDDSVYVDETAEFTVTATSDPDLPLSYQWYRTLNRGFSWIPVEGEVTNILTLENVTLDMNGTMYHCVVSVLDVSVTSRQALLEVKPLDLPNLYVFGVVESGGIGLSDVIISYQIDNEPEETVVTDALGNYAISVQPGQTFVMTDVTKTGFEVSMTLLDTTIGAVSVEFNITMDAVVKEERTVSGMVTSNGFALSGVTISYEINGQLSSITTGADGTYSIVVETGDTFEITEVAKEYFQSQTLLPPAIVITENIMFNIVMEGIGEPREVSGMVTDMGSVGIEGVTISYKINGNAATITTGPDGTYSIDVSIGDVFVITDVTRTGYLLSSPLSPPELILDNKEFNFIMTDMDPHEITGTVTFNGNGLSGAVIEYTVDGDLLLTVTDMDGNYSITAPFASEVKITNVTSYGLILSPGGQVPRTFIMNSDVTDVNFTLAYDPSVTATITFDPNGGTGTIGPVEGGFGTTITLPSDIFEKEGYTQTGWSTQQNGDAEYVPGGQYVITGDATLYAVWAENPKVIIFFDGNGGTTPDDQSQTSWTGPIGSTILLPTASDFVRPGYTLLGWSESKYATSPQLTPGAAHTVTKAVTFYAVWEINDDATVTYNGNQGTPGRLKDIGPWGSVVILPGASRPGYTFQGWDTDPAGTTAVHQTGEEFTIPKDGITLYAVWSENDSVTVTFHGNEGLTPGGQSQITWTIPDGSEIELPDASVFTRPGYTLLGWSLFSTAAEATWYPGETYTVDGGQTLYAVWTPNPEVTVIFDGNGGTASGLPQTSWTGSIGLTINLPTDSDFARPGYTLLGWSESKYASVPDLAPGYTYTVTKAVTFYAVWEINDDATVTYNGNQGTPDRPKDTEPWGSVVFLPGASRPGYTFQGWDTNPAGGDVVYAEGDEFTIPKDGITLYAVWHHNGNVTITFHGNEGLTPDGQSQITWTIPDGSEIELPDDSVFIRSGYTLLGWSLSITAAEATWIPGAKYIVDGGQTLYAVWSENERVTVSFDGNGNGKLETQTVTIGTKVILPDASEFTRPGYTLLGWSEIRNDASGMLGPGAEHMVTKAVTFYAVWEINDDATVTYNGNQGTPDKPKDTGPWGSVVLLPGASRPGYTFQGWDTDPAGGDVVYAEGDEFTIPKDGITLYAVWHHNGNVTITFHGNGGTTSDSQTQITWTGPDGSEIELPDDSVFTRSGYTLLGWSLSDAAVEATWCPGAIYTVDGGQTLYAVWTPNPEVTVIFDGNGGTTSGGESQTSRTGSIGLTIFLPTDSDFVRPGYTLLGWSESKYATSPELIPGAEHTVTKAVTFYAVWEINDDATVTYNGNQGTPDKPKDTGPWGSVVLLPGASRPGYTFQGWDTDPAGDYVVYAEGDEFTIPKDGITLYAVWSENGSVTVTFHGNGGFTVDGDSEISSTVLNESEVVLPNASVFTRPGYTLLGWSLSITAVEATWCPGAIYTVDGGQTLYAVWAANPEVMVVLNGNGGTTPGGDPEITLTGPIGSILTLPDDSDFARYGYILLGWSESKNATVADWSPGDPYVITKAIALYAVWYPYEYTISGTVTFEGSGLPDVVITYTINGITGSVTTDSEGRYTITVHHDDIFSFISVKKKGFAVDQQMITIDPVIQNEIVDFTMSESDSGVHWLLLMIFILVTLELLIIIAYHQRKYRQ